MNIASAYCYIKNTLPTSSPELSLFFTKKRLNTILLFLLLFLFSCSDKSCIEANDFGEYETEYLTVNSGVNLNCSFGIKHPLEDDGKSPDLYYKVSDSFKVMPYSVNADTDDGDIDKFFDIITTEYDNFLLNEGGINNITEEKYTNFFTMFDGEIAGRSTMPDFIRGGECEESAPVVTEKCEESKGKREDILIYQRNRIMIDDSNNPVDNTNVNHRDMVKFLYGGDLDVCSSGVDNKRCVFTPNIIDKYEWVSKTLDGTDNFLGCIMEQSPEGSDTLDASDDVENRDVNNTYHKKDIKIKYPPTSVFLECITDAIRACNAKKIETYLTDSSQYSSNNDISRAVWSKTSQYDEEINDALRITTEADIYIKAIGDVSLGAASTYPDMFAAANVNLELQSRKNNEKDFSDWGIFNENVLDISVTAKWTNGNSDIYYTEDPATVNKPLIKDSLKKSYNALSRLAIYIDDKDPLPEEDKRISFYPEILAKSLDPEPKITDQGSFAKYVVQDNFAIINIVFDNEIPFKDVSIKDGGVHEIKDLGQLIADTHLRVYFNDNRLHLDSTTTGVTRVENIFAEKGDVIRVELLDPTVPADNSSLISIALEDIITLRGNNAGKAISINIGNNYISEKILISGLYSLTSACNGSPYFVVANNSNIYTDMSEVGLIPTSNVNEIYLRKNQRVYFIAGDNCSSDSNSFSLNLEHQRPAFLCQKRNHKFNISKLFCSSGGGCVAPTPPPHNNCTSCDIGAGAGSNDVEILELLNDCKSSVVYVDGAGGQRVVGDLGDLCDSVVDNECSSKYPDSYGSSGELITNPEHDPCIDLCTKCVKDTFSNPTPVNESYEEDEIDICYDLESYTGKASKIDGQKISDIGKGARELFFNGYYGNFVREDVSDDVVGKFLLNPNKDYSKKYSGSLGLLRPGKIKFLVVNNDNLDLKASDFSGTTNDVKFNNIGDGNGYLIEFGTINKTYSNGDMMESYLCHSSKCNKLESGSFSDNDIDNVDIVGISALQYSDEYRGRCKEIVGGDVSRDDVRSNFGYHFDKFGRLEEINKKDSKYCEGFENIPNNKTIAKKHYSNKQNDIKDDKDYQLYFSIIDDQENNCMIYDERVGYSPEACGKNINYNAETSLKPKCNGVKTSNPYYNGVGLSCNEGRDPILNPHYGADDATTKTLCPTNCLVQNNGSVSALQKNQCNSAEINIPLALISGERYICPSSCTTTPSTTTPSTTTPSTTTPSTDHFCQTNDLSKCKDKKYYCANKLMDNYGSYDLKVKVKDNSAFNGAGFGTIYGMVAPITDLIYGSPEICIDGKSIVDQEGDVIGTCKEIKHNKKTIRVGGLKMLDLQKKEYVIINDAEVLIQKYNSPLGDEILCNDDKILQPLETILVQTLLPDLTTSPPSLCKEKTTIIGGPDIDIYEGNVYEYGEGIKHPDHGYVIRKDSMAKMIYQNIINNPVYKALFKTLMVLSIMFYGGSYLLGMSEFSRAEIMTRVIKLSLLMLFLSPGGWVWFQNIFVSLFEYGSDYLTLLMISAFESDTVIKDISNNKYFDPALLFSSIDKMIALLSPTVFYKITALFFSSLYGYFYLLIIFYAITEYFYAAIKVLLLYLSAKLFINFTFLLAPILLLFILFEQTKDTFNRWLKQLVSFSMQQIVILFSFTLFNTVLYYLIKSILAYKVCWGTVIQSDIIVKISLLKWWTIAGDMDNAASASVPGLMSVFALLFMVKIMSEFVSQASQFGERLADGLNSGNAVSAMENQLAIPFKGVKKLVLGIGKQSTNAIGKKVGVDKVIGDYGMVDRAKGVLFNAGLEVKEVRDGQVKAERQANALRSKLKRDGDNAVKQYKVNSIVEGRDFAKKGDMLTKINTLNEVRDKAMMASLKKHHADKGSSKDEGELRAELNKLKDKNYNRASWSHDNLVSLAGSVISRHYGAIPRDRDTAKHAEVTSEDIKSAYQKSGPDGVEKFKDITSEVKDNIAKRNLYDYDSNADRFVKNINKKSKEDTERINKKNAIDDKVKEGSYEVKDAAEELKDGIVNTLSDSFEKRNLIKSSLNSLFSIRPLSLTDKASGGRFSAMGRIHSGIRDVRDAKKSDARILAENHLINKKEITPERLYDKRWYKNNEALIRQFEGRDEEKKNKAFLERIKETASQAVKLVGELFSLKGIKEVPSRADKLVGGLFEFGDKVNSAFSSILTTTGFRSEYNPEEREKIEKIIDRIEVRGGTKELDRVVDEIGKKIQEYNNNKNNNSNLQMKDGESKDLIKEIIGKFGSKDVENVKEMAKELLLEEDNDRDWRELFTDTNQDLVVDPALK